MGPPLCGVICYLQSTWGICQEPALARGPVGSATVKVSSLRRLTSSAPRASKMPEVHNLSQGSRYGNQNMPQQSLQLLELNFRTWVEK